MPNLNKQSQISEPAEPWVCCHCVDEAGLKAQISESSSQQCGYCQNIAPAWGLSDLGSTIHSVLEDHYRQVFEEYPFLGGEGEDIYSVISTLADLTDDNLIEDIRKQCEEIATEGMDFMDVPDPAPYTEDSEYAEMPVDTQVWSQKWQDFEIILKERSRFFSDEAKSILEEIFADLETLASKQGKSVLTPAGPGTTITEVSRARSFYDTDKLTLALGNPERDLGPPPPNCASAGRMNAQGISLFYGADTPEVCLSEVRPPVGSWVAVARFEIIRPIQLLNLQLLQDLEHPSGSLFDPGYSEKLSKYQFLRTLTNLVSRPVMPHDEHSDYLTTQAVSDFLSAYGKTDIDGIIFPSVQNPDHGRNIVLFHKASLVEERKLPQGTDIYCQSDSYEDDQWIREFHVFEKLPKEPREEKPEPIHWTEFLHIPPQFQRERDEWRKPTMRVKLDTIVVHEIKSSTFQVINYTVHRTQFSQ